MKSILIPLMLAKLLFMNIAVISQTTGNIKFGQLVHADRNSGTEETDAIQQRILNGFAAGDNFGVSVSSAGDVNGDGYTDIIAGAPFNDASATDGGRAYVYFGGSAFNTVPDVILNGTVASGWFGVSVASAGDVNGDGFDDVIAGAMGFSSFTGRAFIYFGGASMNNVADVTLTGEAVGDEFGRSVSGSGDVNGDGYSDVVVGAQGNNSVTGEAYVFFGGPSMNSIADVTIAGLGTGHSFGYSVSLSGDMNGDGYDDVIVGAPSAFSVGRTYLYYGGASMNNTTDLIFTGSGTNSNFGSSVCYAGDINKDGYADVIIGSPGFSSNTGRAYIYFGGSTPDAVSELTISGEATGHFLGYSVSGAGDINGDTYSDMIISAPGFASSKGRTYLFKGSESLDPSADKYFTGENAGDNFGISSCSLGDVNGDGYDDITLGAYGNDINGSNSGRAYVYFEKLSGTDLKDITLSESIPSDNFGKTAAAAGDVNGDGFDDAIVSQFYSSSNTWKAYIYFGGTILNSVADVTLIGETDNNIGCVATAAGDVNNDGYGDVIVGAPNYDNGKGKAYIYFGGVAMNNVADVTLVNPDSIGLFGTQAVTAGDMNGDGFSDVAVSCPNGGGGSSIGRVHVYFGGSAINNTVDVSMFIYNTVMNSFGIVISAGDFNGDGFSDLLVSSHKINTAHIFLGSETTDGISDMILSGSGSNYSQSLSYAGDFNGDGFDDFLISDFMQEGRVVKLYYGGFIINPNPGLMFSSPESSNQQFGISVSGSGDINGDGFADIVICNDSYGSSGNTLGRGYSYFGGPAADTIPDITYTGDTANIRLSIFTSSGDLNNDGLGDIIAGTLNSGKANIYLSSPPNMNPRIFYSKDVPFDQGGKVHLKWKNSAYDISGGYVTDYKIERSLPPGTSGFSWETIGNVTASGREDYSFTAATLNDSMSGNSGTTSFRIVAAGSDPYFSWYSNTVNAYSVDNLDPLPPQNLTANLISQDVSLDWNDNTEQDLHHYEVFRDGIYLNSTLGSIYLDSGAMQNSNHLYEVSAVDIHGNSSAHSDSVFVATGSTTSTVILSMLIEGFYVATLDRMSVSDEVTLQLRNAAPPYDISGVVASVIDKATFTGLFEFPSLSAGHYYLSVTHRNSIETWSSGTIYVVAGDTTLFSFISEDSLAFGGNQKNVNVTPSRFAFFSGDVNQDGTVDATDVSEIDNDAANFVTGKVPTDLTGDEFVDGTDFVIADNNAANFVSVIRP